jgi:hypothetical protein
LSENGAKSSASDTPSVTASPSIFARLMFCSPRSIDPALTACLDDRNHVTSWWDVDRQLRLERCYGIEGSFQPVYRSPDRIEPEQIAIVQQDEAFASERRGDRRHVNDRSDDGPRRCDFLVVKREATVPHQNLGSSENGIPVPFPVAVLLDLREPLRRDWALPRTDSSRWVIGDDERQFLLAELEARKWHDDAQPDNPDET